MISSLIARLKRDERLANHAVQQLRLRPEIEIGSSSDNFNLPLVVEAESAQQTDAIHRWISSLQGVDFVDVVFVYFDEQDSKDGAARG